MGTSVNGVGPYSPSDVDPTKWGSGGKNRAPNQGYSCDGAVLNALLQRLGTPAANTAELQAIVAADLADGMLFVTKDTYTLWVWEPLSTATADATHLTPTFAGAGAGRFVALAGGIAPGATQHVSVDIPLATLQAKTSGTAFNVGAALPANARLLKTEINVVAALAGTGPMSAAHATVQNTGETAGAIVASADVFTATGVQAPTGSNPYASRGGQQLQMMITTVGGTLAAATAGHLTLDLFFDVGL